MDMLAIAEIQGTHGCHLQGINEFGRKADQTHGAHS